jgi:hypothetical protein
VVVVLGFAWISWKLLGVLPGSGKRKASRPTEEKKRQ